MSLLLCIIMTDIKENIITKLQKLYSLPRNPRAGNKSPTLFVKKPLCVGDLLPACKIFIERPALLLKIVDLKLQRSVFLKNFKKKIFFWYFYSFWKELSREYLVVSKFLLEVPKFKENVLIYLILVIKVCDLLFTLIQVTKILAAYFRKWINTDY